MARRKQSEALYQAFAAFRDRCLLADSSLLWPEAVLWTKENVAELRRRLIDNPILGAQATFTEKLEDQLRGGPRELWMMIADLYYVYFLPSDFIKLATKRSDIEWAAANAGNHAPTPSDPIWAAQSAGFTRTSMKYHSKYSQFWVLVLLAERVKQSKNPGELFSDPAALQALLDSILEAVPNPIDRAYDMRHAVLYLAFPDSFERIISTRDKESIAQTFGPRLKGGVSPDTDATLRSIRADLGDQLTTGNEPLDFYQEHLKKQWRPMGEPKVPYPLQPQGKREPQMPLEPGEVDEIVDVLNHTRNLVLYGPPGTGKTYLALKAAEAIVKPQVSRGMAKPAVLQRAIEGVAFYDVLAIGMFLAAPERRFSVAEIEEMPAIKARYQLAPVRNPRENIWSYLQAHTDPSSPTVKVTRRSSPFIFDKGEGSRWFLTEAGREYVSENLLAELKAVQPATAPRAEARDYIEWVTFHQSYSYEDFVEGLRPVPSGEDSTQISYEVVPGAFRRIATLAFADPSSKYVLVIDEINRANVSKVLGELITLIEDDKRLGESNALKVRLPYSHEQFSVPGNLYIIATMNTADRSIALLDVALRRRFAFMELMPRADLLGEVEVHGSEGSVRLASALESLNSRIRRLLDRDHQIGHSYFLRIVRAPESERLSALEFVWNQQIMPLLEEYFYSHREHLLEVLPSFREAGVLEEGLDLEAASGVDLPRLSGDDLVFALGKLSAS